VAPTEGVIPSRVVEQEAFATVPWGPGLEHNQMPDHCVAAMRVAVSRLVRRGLVYEDGMENPQAVMPGVDDWGYRLALAHAWEFGVYQAESMS